MNKTRVALLLMAGLVCGLSVYIFVPHLQLAFATSKSFTHCTLSETGEALIDLHSNDYVVEGCPNARLYINDWDNLTTLQKLAIQTQLEAEGWVEEEE